ncbi:hypothetical protein Tco_1452697, partial [Tanacetum coccineum]
MQEGNIPSTPRQLTCGTTWHATWRTQTRPDPDPAQDLTRPGSRPDLTRPKTRPDPPVDWRSTTVDWWLTDGPTVVRRWSAAVDLRGPSLTTVDPVVAPVTAGRLCGTTQVVTRGTTNDWYEVAGT